jgi:hypothetical protein
MGRTIDRKCPIVTPLPARRRLCRQAMRRCQHWRQPRGRTGRRAGGGACHGPPGPTAPTWTHYASWFMRVGAPNRDLPRSLPNIRIDRGPRSACRVASRTGRYTVAPRLRQIFSPIPQRPIIRFIALSQNSWFPVFSRRCQQTECVSVVKFTALIM